MVDDTGIEPWSDPYRAEASTADILACFRLLLGRYPNAEEWPAHAMRAGEPLQEVVAAYTRSPEFARRGLLAREMLGEIILSDLPGFKIFTALHDAAVGKHVRADNYERDVSAVFRRVLRPGMGVVDIGANIGYFSMLSASIVGADGYVLALEPNPQNAKLLEASRKVNGFGHVSAVQVAASSATGLLVLHTSYSTGTTSDLADDLNAVLGADTVACMTVDSLLPGERRIDLIKIDIDGAEYKALLGCQRTIQRHRPVIVSEFAPGLLPGLSGVTGEEYLCWIGAQGYDVAVIEPDGSLAAMGQDWASVLAAYQMRGTDHIDILASPS